MRKPTMKQKKALENLVGNGGNVTKAMIEAGYSEATANTPGKLTNSVGWEGLMEQYFPDDVLGIKIKEGLEANRTIAAQVIIKSDNPKVKNKSATARDVDFIDVPDHAVRHKFVETALKLKAKFPDIALKLKGDKDNPLEHKHTIELTDETLKRILNK